MTNIFFQNGMDNNYASAESSAVLIKNITEKDIGLIVNSTSSTERKGAKLLFIFSVY